MKKNFACQRGASVFSAVLLAFVLSGCGADTAAPKVIETQKVHTQIKSNLRSAFKNLVNESKSPSANSLKSSLSGVKRLIGEDLGGSLPSDIDIESIAKVIEIVFESELVQEIFSDTNISARTDTEVTYAVKLSLCDKLSDLVPSRNNDLVGKCKTLLESNDFDFHVKTLPNDQMEIELWHGLKDATAKQFVVGLNMSPNSFGARFNLAGVKTLVQAVISLVGPSAADISLGIDLKKLAGAASAQLRFKSDTSESGCKNQERLCFIFNVDENIDVELNLGEPLVAKFAKSPKDHPTLSIAGAETGFKAALNLGAIEGSYAAFRVFLEASQFDLSLPNMSEGAEVVVENFKAGALPSFFQGFGKKFVVDLANDARLIKSIKVAIDAAKTLVDLSPLKIKVSVEDENNSSCQAFESLEVATDASVLTKLQFLSLNARYSDKQVHAFYANPAFRNARSTTCDESSLLAYMFWSMFNVSSEGCDSPGALFVKEGSLDLTYAYKLNDSNKQSSNLQVSAGQCLQI